MFLQPLYSPPILQLPLGWQSGFVLHLQGQEPHSQDWGTGEGSMGAVGTEGPKARFSPDNQHTPPLWHNRTHAQGTTSSQGQAGDP